MAQHGLNKNNPVSIMLISLFINEPVTYPAEKKSKFQ